MKTNSPLRASAMLALFFALCSALFASPGEPSKRLQAFDQAVADLQESANEVHDAVGLQDSWTKDEVRAGHRLIFKDVAQFTAIARGLLEEAEAEAAQPEEGEEPPKVGSIENPHPGGKVDIPAGKPAISWLIAEARADYPNPLPGDRIQVFLPKGVIKGVVIGGQGWTPLPSVKPWWGDATLQLFGHPSGTTIKAVNNEGWGNSLHLRDDSTWSGRVHFVDLEIECSGTAGLFLGNLSQGTKLLEEVELHRCSFRDHPNPNVRTTWGIQANKVALRLYDCLFEIPRSKEHAVYVHAPVGSSGMWRCIVTGCGGQPWQEVNRPGETPYVGTGTTTIKECTWSGYHGDPGRAGSALTVAGSGRDLVFEDNVVTDLDGQGYSSGVVWDGGSYWIFGEDGQPVGVGPGSDLRKSKPAAGTVLVTSNVFAQHGNRPLFQVDSALSATVTGNVFLADEVHRNVQFSSSTNGQAPVADIHFEGNNTPELLASISDLGIPASFKPPRLRWRKQAIGDVRSKLVVKQGVRVE